MLTIKKLKALQVEAGVALEGEEGEVDYETYLSTCRLSVKATMPRQKEEGLGLTAEERVDELYNLITEFVRKHPKRVKGYMTLGVLDSELLLEDLLSSMTGASILKDALEDPEIDEIQIVDKNTIFVVRKGVQEYYRDRHGRIPQFSSDAEIRTLIARLTFDGTGNNPQFTEGHPLLNVKTAEKHYRLNAVHPVLNTRFPAPYDYPVTSVVIRKFKSVHLDIDDLVISEACTEAMASLLLLFGRASLKLCCVGETGSGKTTLLRIIGSTIPKKKKIILIQNPTEITYTERDKHGRLERNVVHHEVLQNATTKGEGAAGSQASLITNMLRETPEVTIVGEARETGEFKQILRAMLTGQIIMFTAHADSAAEYIERHAQEIGGERQAALAAVSEAIDIVVAQHRFSNGDRKIVEISEVEGVDDLGNPKIRQLYVYKYSGELEDDPKRPGKKRSKGHFEQTAQISDKLKKLFYKSGITREELERIGVIEKGRKE